MVLPTNIDATYANSGTDASIALHQQHHDEIHTAVNALPSTYAAATHGHDIVDVMGLTTALDDGLAATAAPRWISPCFTGNAGTDGTPTTNRVYLLRLPVGRSCTADGVVWINGSVVTGSVLIGLYGPVAHTSDTCTGATLRASAAVAASGATTTAQVGTFTTPAVLAAGDYYLAVGFSSNACRYYRQANGVTQAPGWGQYFDRAYDGTLPATCPTAIEDSSNMPGARVRTSA